ncbi:MAG: hypothetical protein QOI15_3100 [Pseudonocardiales bacterium]|nr:hypothetical protein [Pseudonocardiales bacterium]
MAQRSNRALVVVLTIAIVAVGGGLALKALWNTAKSHLASDTCTVGGGDYVIDTDQASVAAAMVGAVTRYRVALPERATVLVLAAALQESKLTNLAPGEGDRDSVGVLQQRPSQGWGNGNAAALTDVGEATTEFLDALVDVPHWRTRPLAAAVQAVQISADGSAYAQHEPEAKALADALQGKKREGITCDFEKPTVVATAAKVADQASSELGIDTPQVVDQLTVRVPGAHWQTVAWFVANANRLGIERVAYAEREWSRTDGWQSGTASRQAVVATMYDLGK